MSKYPLLNTLFASNRDEFIKSFYDLLVSRKFKAFTLWEIIGGSICGSLKQLNGVTDGLFDIYDLGYSGEKAYRCDINLEHFNSSRRIYAAFFCTQGSTIRYGLTFHQKLDDDAFEWLTALLPLLSTRALALHREEHNMDIFVDYQKKIDFVKESGRILKVLSVNEVLVNALYFFSETFHAEAGCAFYNDFYEAFGLETVDLKENIFVDEENIHDYAVKQRETLFVETGITTKKFNVSNAFIINDNLSGAFFILFNITVETVPDKEFSVLISTIVSIAVENAKYHERMTRLMLEEAEMSQTVAILNRFVRREVTHAAPEIFGVNYPAKSTGGDFFTVIDLPSYTFLCVADVCGKGYSAAVFTVMLAAVTELGGAERDLKDLKRLVNGINQYLVARDFEDRFITAYFAVFDKDENSLTYISCGHEPIYLMNETDAVRAMKSKNLPLGLMQEDYEPVTVRTRPKDMIFIYTDGVVEYIGHEELVERLKTMVAMPAKEIVGTLYRELVTDPDTQKDDFTCLVLKVAGE